MINLLVSLAVGLGISFSSAVWAKNPEMAVKNRDSNGDGKVILDEWDKKEIIFNKIDLDGDVYLTVKEFAIKWGVPVPGESPQEIADSTGVDTGSPTTLSSRQQCFIFACRDYRLDE